jgi:hypothetical protein
LEDENSELQHTALNLYKANDELRRKVNIYLDGRSVLIDNANAREARLVERISFLEKDREDAAAKVSDVESICRVREEETTASKKALDDVTNLMNSKLTRMESLETQNESLRLENANLVEENRRFEAQKLAAEDIAEQIKEKVAELLGDNRNMRDRYRRLALDLDRLVADNAQFKKIGEKIVKVGKDDDEEPQIQEFAHLKPLVIPDDIYALEAPEAEATEEEKAKDKKRVRKRVGQARTRLQRKRDAQQTEGAVHGQGERGNGSEHEAEGEGEMEGDGFENDSDEDEAFMSEQVIRAKLRIVKASVRSEKREVQRLNRVNATQKMQFMKLEVYAKQSSEQQNLFLEAVNSLKEKNEALLTEVNQLNNLVSTSTQRNRIED